MILSIEDVQQGLLENRYIADRSLATIVYLHIRMGKPLFLEGEAGVGKTDLAKALANFLDTRLIRLQCYEGLDVHNTIYEWDYARQILHLRMLEASDASRSQMEHDLYSRNFLLSRPLLQAIEHQGGQPAVLLIDEIDRADEEFESFLLELLSDFQITIPEIGTIRADKPPLVVITSNRTREVHDALKRRCLYNWIDYPSFDTELNILRLKVTGIGEQLSFQIVAAVQQLRNVELFKAPGVAETLDWATALLAMETSELDESSIADTLGVLLKYQDDIERVRGPIARQLASISSAA